MSAMCRARGTWVGLKNGAFGKVFRTRPPSRTRGSIVRSAVGFRRFDKLRGKEPEALLWAVKTRDHEAMQILLSKSKFEPAALGTCLDVALRVGDERGLEILLEAGARKVIDAGIEAVYQMDMKEGGEAGTVEEMVRQDTRPWRARRSELRRAAAEGRHARGRQEGACTRIL
jgi:hypothetical protein